jgi:hypothetical protein
MLFRSVIECLLYKPFWNDLKLDHVGSVNRLITMDETWIHIHIKSRYQRIGSPHPKKFKRQASLSRVLASVLWYKDGFRLPRKGATITAQYYVALLYKLKPQLVYAAAHKASIIHQKLADLHFEVLKHSACSSYLAPLDY